MHFILILVNIQFIEKFDVNMTEDCSFWFWNGIQIKLSLILLESLCNIKDGSKQNVGNIYLYMKTPSNYSTPICLTPNFHWSEVPSPKYFSTKHFIKFIIWNLPVTIIGHRLFTCTPPYYINKNVDNKLYWYIYSSSDISQI